MMKKLFIFAFAHYIHAVIAQPNYIGRNPCASNETIIGYNDTDLLNQDIVQDVQYYMFGDGEDPPEIFHYVLCPDTEFKIANTLDLEHSEGGSPIIPGLANSFFTCGEDGKSENNCTITGGDFHFYFPDFIIAQEVYMLGITFENSNAASVYGDAHPSSHVSFLDCHWKVSHAHERQPM